MNLIKYEPKLLDVILLAQWLKVPEPVIPDFLNQWKETCRNPNVKYVLGFQNKNHICAFIEIRQIKEREWVVVSQNGKQSEVCFLTQKFAKKFDALQVELWSECEMPGFETVEHRYGLKFIPQTQDTKKEGLVPHAQEPPSTSPETPTSTSEAVPAVNSEDQTNVETEDGSQQPGQPEPVESSGESV